MSEDQEERAQEEEPPPVSTAPKGWGDGGEIRKSFGVGTDLESFSKLCIGPGGPPCGKNSH